MQKFNKKVLKIRLQNDQSAVWKTGSDYQSVIYSLLSPGNTKNSFAC
jgi:hypothetical protein